jgi:tetratricopeptide (TPR) repeat protein/tRNA A-37 threonylcarbamoyl transferase component Bud32
MIGQTISQYRILEELGAGGMGVVYKAEDTKLKRTVALKFLSPQSLGSKEEQSRFVHEAQAAAALDHSNICTVYEINEAEGKSFIAMAYVDGPTLKKEVESGRLDVDRAVDIAIQVADGLRVAHSKGIIHRDIKSANIMLTSEGQAKITDFGLAKLPGRTKLTKTGSTVGTLAYMSPEQAQGVEVDHRSDIWSLGVVLYELLSGKVPFKGDHEAAMVYSIMNQEMPPLRDLMPDMPAELDAIVAKMLQKNPNDRYATAEELLSDLRKVQSGAAIKVALPMSRKAKRVTWGLAAVLVVAVVVSSVIILNRRPATVSARTLAVVDFDIIGGEEAGHLAEGLAEGISVKLSKLGSVRVVSSDDIRRLRKKDLSAKEVASQLGAQFALGGSLLKSGEQIRVTPQLIDASTGDVVWSELLDREFSDVFGFLDEISLKIVAALELELDPAEKLALEEKPTESPEAYEHYLKGRHFYYRITFADNELSVKEFQKALQTDADYPLALAGLADAYVQRYKERYDYDEYWLDEAEHLIDQALEFDRGLAEGYKSRAALLVEKKDVAGAFEAADKARELHPDWDDPYLILGEIHQKRGERDKALEMFGRALAIRQSVDAWCGKGGVHEVRGEIDSAEVAYRAALDVNPDHERPYNELGEMHWELSKREEAEKEFRTAIEKRPDRSLGYWGLIYILVETGRIEEAGELLRELVEQYPYNWEAYEVLYEYLGWWVGDYDAALKVIDEAIARNPDRVWPHLLAAQAYAWKMGTTSQPEKAVAAVQRALELRPNSSRVLQWAGGIYSELGEFDRALDYYNQGLDVSPGSVDILTSIAGLLRSNGQYERAAESYYKAVRELPGVYGRYFWLGETLAHLDRSEEFLDLLEKAASRYGDDPSFWVGLSREQCLAGRYDDAVSSSRRALEAKRHGLLLIRLGISLWLAEDFEEALETFQDAADNRWSNRWRIAILKYLGRFEEIEAFLEDIRENTAGGGSLSPFWVWRASDYYDSMRRFDDQLSVLEEARGHEEEIWSQDNVLQLAVCYRKKGDVAEAKQVLRDAESSLPVDYHQWAEQEFATIAAIEGDLKGAVEHAKKAHKGSSWPVSVHPIQALLARLQFASGRREEALATLTPARPSWFPFSYFPPALYQRGQFEMVSGSSEADDYFRQALAAATRAASGGSYLAHIPWGEARSYCALAAAHLGNPERARSEIEYALQLEPERADIAYYAAAVYSLLGDTSLALRWLETSVERGHQDLWWARVDPDLDPLRELPRFQEITNDWDRRLRAMIN